MSDVLHDVECGNQVGTTRSDRKKLDQQGVGSKAVQLKSAVGTTRTGGTTKQNYDRNQVGPTRSDRHKWDQQLKSASRDHVKLDQHAVGSTKVRLVPWDQVKLEQWEQWGDEEWNKWFHDRQ